MNYSFEELIKRVDFVENSAIPNEVKLKQSGILIYQGSLEILEQAQAIFDTLRYPEINKEDTLVDASFSQFLASLTQQSISTNFLKKYLQPQVRAEYHRETNTRIKSLTTDEALNEFERVGIKDEVISLAHDEDIEAWIALVNKCFETDPEIKRTSYGLESNSSGDPAELGSARERAVIAPRSLSLSQIVQTTNLSQAQVFISLLFGGFILKQDDSFYDGNSIQVERKTLTGDDK